MRKQQSILEEQRVNMISTTIISATTIYVQQPNEHNTNWNPVLITNKRSRKKVKRNKKFTEKSRGTYHC